MIKRRIHPLNTWVEIRLREVGISETDKLTIRGVSGEAVIYEHPIIGRIIVNESDIIIEKDSRNLFGMGFNERAFREFCLGYFGRSRSNNKRKKYYEEGRLAREMLNREELEALRSFYSREIHRQFQL